jgi:autotransporter-associated beta strand protein
VDFQNPLDLGAATRTVQVDDGAAAIDGKLSGSLTNGNLTKTGPGTLALTGSNSYAGATTVSAGTLLVNGTNSGTGMITAASGASLGGTGSIAGPVTFNTGSTAVFTVTRDPVTQANTTPLTVTGAMDFWDTEIHLNVPADLPSGVYTLATSSATPIGTIVTTPVLDSGTYAPGVTSAEVSLDVINNRLLLTVNGLPTHPTKLAITSVNGGVSPFAGAGFNVVVQAQDVNGASRQALTDTSVKLSLNTGSGPLGGTLTGIIPAGAVSVTISGVTYGTAASGVVLAAARTSGDLLTGGNSAPFTVLPGTLPAYLVVSGFPSPQTAGSPGSMTVTAKTAIGTTATTYTGTVHFTSTAVAAGLPTDYTFVGSDNGVHTFSGVTLNTAGIQSITATDMVSPTITGTQSDIAVTAAAATSLVVAGYPSPRLASVADSVTVTAKDAYGNTAPSYTGTIQFSSSDGTASLPGNYTFTGGDAGTHTFMTGVTLNTLGVQSLTATDLAAPSITGTQSGITVWVPPTSFSWRSPAANGNWSDATKWAQSSNLDYAPVTTGQSDYILNFIAGTYAANQNLSNGFLVNQLNFAGTVTVDGANGLALAGTLPTINQNSANVVTINPPVSLTTGATVAGSGNGQVNLAGLISGASSLTKSNPGMLKIYGLVPNTYSGGTIINSGTLHIGTINPDGQSPFCVGVLGTGSVTLGSGTTLELDRVSADNTLISNGGTIFSNNGWGSTWTGPITLNTTTTFNIQYKMSCSGGISGTGGVIKTGADTLTLSGTLNYTGNTTVSGGTLSINSAYLADASTVTIATGAKLDLNTAGASDTITTLVLGGVTVPTGTYNATHPTYGLYFSGSGSLVVGSDYNTWLAGFTFAEGANTTPAGDPDGDGVSNQEEYAFGLNPTLATSVSPITAQFNPTTGNFQYTRRATPAATKLTYNVLTSSDLATWATGGATETGFTTAGNIETVTVNVTTPAVGGKLFVRVEAVPAP